MSELVIVGSGLSAISAALAAIDAGVRVVVLAPPGMIGGQLTAQMAPPDEHRRIERLGATRRYAALRRALRDAYRDGRLKDRVSAEPHLNPGAGWVSPLCVEPRVAEPVLERILEPHVASGMLSLWRDSRVIGVDTAADQVTALDVLHGGDRREIRPGVVIDATETGELIELAGVEHVTGAESRDMHDEPSAPEAADPGDIQSVTWAFALSYHRGEDHTIERPADYERWCAARPGAWGGRSVLSWHGPDDPEGRSTVYSFRPSPSDDPGAIETDHRAIPPSPDLWSYRRVRAAAHHRPRSGVTDASIINWPQNDYVGGSVIGDGADHHRRQARAQSLALLYWLQHDAPRPDGGTGFPGLRLAPEVSGTADGFAQEPYIRESRRIVARQTVREQDVAIELRPTGEAVTYGDSIGIGHYYWMDLHPSVTGKPGRGTRPLPFEIPLGALIPQRVTNLVAAGKSIGTTHLTNGCYRVHPVEWAIGEAAGEVAALACRDATTPAAVHGTPRLVAELQSRLTRAGAPLHWPRGTTW